MWYSGTLWIILWNKDILNCMLYEQIYHKLIIPEWNYDFICDENFLNWNLTTCPMPGNFALGQVKKVCGLVEINPDQSF